MILSIIYIINKTIDLVEYERRRSNKLSTNVVIIRQSFRKDIQKILFISIFINNYIYYIRDVNLVN